MATPLLIQCFCLCVGDIGTRINITKLVECPVVDRVPCLKEVLYTGQQYTWAVPLVAPVYCSGTPSTRGTLAFSLGANEQLPVQCKDTVEYRILKKAIMNNGHKQMDLTHPQQSCKNALPPSLPRV